MKENGLDLAAQSVSSWGLEITVSRAAYRVEGQFVHLAEHMHPRRLIAEPREG